MKKAKHDKTNTHKKTPQIHLFYCFSDLTTQIILVSRAKTIIFLKFIVLIVFLNPSP